MTALKALQEGLRKFYFDADGDLLPEDVTLERLDGELSTAYFAGSSDLHAHIQSKMPLPCKSTSNEMFRGAFERVAVGAHNLCREDSLTAIDEAYAELKKEV